MHLYEAGEFICQIIILLSESFDPCDFGMTNLEKMRRKGVVLRKSNFVFMQSMTLRQFLRVTEISGFLQKKK